ncbi:histidine kinase [Yimella sp. cx-51]|uniref:histidine kinase n=1 Tax=Yimella sp. cx-51 TaxID=2770551 RepID=UPI00165D3FF3|nr:histidine kinase [Yimella sp. cx-51]MBC9956146.1 histidine kinase [Yimella sp. cx-51]MBC9956158.1 histidine kinase [Yimella sp. cx-51]MBD2758312.1 histidine kinase [Yimella sp. cx-573]QTH37327.1 histidine kinase [Yimella sp. cx-51]
MPSPAPVTIVLLVGALLILLLLWQVLRRNNLQKGFVSERDRATYDTLHKAALAGRHLGAGLDEGSAQKALPHLRALLATPALALTGRHGVLAWDGTGEHHVDEVHAAVAEHIDDGKLAVVTHLDCSDPDCPVRSAVLAPIQVRDSVVGMLVASGSQPSAGLARAAEELAGWVATQVELADLSADRTRTMEAELRALRAQISPHFIYNSLGAIASFVRTDPDRARELLLEFADFTRYALRQGGASATLAEELHNVERYLVLEQARFGERLQLRMKVAPEVLPIRVPYLAIQPLVENAVRHGLAPKAGVGTVVLVARDLGAEAEISVEDDGVGAEPARIQEVLDSPGTSDSIGLGNVDARLRQIYGDDRGLVVETAPGSGMKVSFRVPKFAPGT